MLNLVLWLALIAGFIGLVLFSWRSAMRRRGFRLLGMLEKETVLRYAVDVPVGISEEVRTRGARPTLLQRRGTVVLTRKRLAGFAHRARFVLVRGGGARPDAVSADGDWLVIRPGARAPAFRFLLPDAQGWNRDARRVLRR